jgi:L,D-transpeptidase ErfK/SrfK
VAAAATACWLSFGAPAPADAQGYSITGGVTSHTIVAGETLATVGSRFGVDPATLASANGLRPNARVARGQVLQIDNRHIVPPDLARGLIIVNVPQRMLFFDDQGAVMAFPVAVGRSTWRTPLGQFRVVKVEADPSWDVPTSIQAEARAKGRILPAVVPPGPDNPLGKYWLGLSLGDVGIHGTNAPSSIYRVTTHGCIRVHPDDIATLFRRVSLQTTGRVVYEPVLLAAVGQQVFVEAHRDVYGKMPDGRAAVQRLADEARVADRVDWPAVDAVLAARAGIARDVTRKNPHGPDTLPQRVTSD